MAQHCADTGITSYTGRSSVRTSPSVRFRRHSDKNHIHQHAPCRNYARWLAINSTANDTVRMGRARTLHALFPCETGTCAAHGRACTLSCIRGITKCHILQARRFGCTPLRLCACARQSGLNVCCRLYYVRFDGFWMCAGAPVCYDLLCMRAHVQLCSQHNTLTRTRTRAQTQNRQSKCHFAVSSRGMANFAPLYIGYLCVFIA